MSRAHGILPTVKRLNWKTEFLLDFGLLLFGAFALPLLIYLVGQQVVGEYEGNGVDNLYGDIFDALANGSMATWLLVVSPFLVVLLLRVLVWLLRQRKRVNHVTN